MPPSDVEPPYRGPFVTIRPEGPAYTVGIEPPMPSGKVGPRSFATKDDAWGAARELWTANRLPQLDLTVAETARAHSEK